MKKTILAILLTFLLFPLSTSAAPLPPCSGNPEFDITTGTSTNCSPNTSATANAPAQGPTQSGQTLDATAGNLGYTPLEPISGLYGTKTGTDFSSLINAFYKILISAGGLIAVGTLIFGGITYMISEVVDKKAEARRRIQAAFWGLLLLISSWIILNTINPQLVGSTTALTGQLGGSGNPVTSQALPAPGDTIIYNSDPTAANAQWEQLYLKCGMNLPKLKSSGTDSNGSYTEYACQ